MQEIDELIRRYPQLESIKGEIYEAYKILYNSYKNGNKLLVAGNGGSAADSDHIVGELMKGFKKKREIAEDIKERLKSIDEEKGEVLSQELQGTLRTIALTNHNALNTAYGNDVNGDLIFAQQLYGYGDKGDVFLAISTSGNSKNILYASVVAKAKGMKIIGLTNEYGGQLNDIADICIKVPETETFKVQELHLPIYHCLCLMLENEFFE